MSINWDDECTKALIASRVFGLNIEYRMCAIDYECGGWKEIQSRYGPEQQAQWLKEAAEWKFPAEYDDYTEAGMIRKACVGRDYAVKLCYPDGCEHWELIPDYPNDIAAAWQVVDWMIEREWVVNLEGNGGKKQWVVQVDGPIRRGWHSVALYGSISGCSHITTAPRAICEAALRALEAAGGE